MAEPWAVLVGLGIVLGAWLGLPGVLVALWIVLVFQVIRGSISWLPIAVVMISVLLGVGRMHLAENGNPAAAFVESQGAIGDVASMPERNVERQTFVVRVDQLTVEDALVDVPDFRVQVTMPQPFEVARGDRLQVWWTPDPLHDVSPGYASYLRAHDVVGLGWGHRAERLQEGPQFFRIVQDVRDRIDMGIGEAIPADPGALASGIVTGNDSGLSAEAKSAFIATGTSHVTAVSGSNIAMVLAIWNLFLPVGRGRRLLAIQVGVAISIWLYALMTGLEPPATRAAAMATIMLFGGRFGRRADPMSLLAISAGLMVLWNPRNVELVSFWLSISASMAIISRVPSSPAKSWQAVGRGVAGGILLAQIATLPLVILTFGSWSMVSVVANVLIAPLMAVAFPMCFLLALVILIVPVLAPVMSWVPEIILKLCLELVRGLSDVLPPIRMEQLGLAGAMAITVPCVLAVLILGRDGQRWGRQVARAVRERGGVMAVVLWGPALGLLAATLAQAISG